MINLTKSRAMALACQRRCAVGLETGGHTTGRIIDGATYP